MANSSNSLKATTKAEPAANDAANETISDQELEWKQKITDKLLDVLDLSLIESIGEEKARIEIREVVNRLLACPG